VSSLRRVRSAPSRSGDGGLGPRSLGARQHPSPPFGSRSTYKNRSRSYAYCGAGVRGRRCRRSAPGMRASRRPAPTGAAGQRGTPRRAAKLGGRSLWPGMLSADYRTQPAPAPPPRAPAAPGVAPPAPPGCAPAPAHRRRLLGRARPSQAVPEQAFQRRDGNLVSLGDYDRFRSFHRWWCWL
jgi:hypothetical protein